MKITKEVLRKVIAESLENTKAIREAFRMEKDFQPGTEVIWNTLEKVTKTTASGKEKLDYERVSHVGRVMELLRSGGATGGVAIVMDDSGNSHEVEVSELSLSM